MAEDSTIAITGGQEPIASLRFPLVLSLLTVAIVCVIEIKHPYFFLQDDNRDQFLPLFVHTYRSVIHGEIPFFNFHQFLGTPCLSSIQSAAPYPMGYVAVFLSKLLFGHFFAAIEILAVIHLVAAVVGFFYLTRTFDLDETSCCVAAIAWGFCGYVTSLGSSWIVIAEFAAYLPWILNFSIRQIAGFDPRGFTILLALRAMALLLGHPQFYLYTVFFEFVSVFSLYFVSSKRADIPALTPPTAHPASSWQKLFTLAITYCANNILAVVLCAPFFLPACHHASQSFRGSRLSFEVCSINSNETFAWLNGLLCPFVHFGSFSWPGLHILSHLGYLTILFGLVAIASIMYSRNARYIITFSAIAPLALLWANNTFITRAFYYLPYFNRFRWPFKLMFYTSFYIVLLSAFGADFLARRFKDKRARSRKAKVAAFLGVLALQAANFLVLYAFSPQHTLGRHLDPVPFDEPSKTLFGDGRIFSIGSSFETDGRTVVHGFTAPLLGYNYATLFNLYHFAGYDVVLPERNAQATLGLNHTSVVTPSPGLVLPFDYLRKWGVRWYVLDRSISLSVPSQFILVQSDRFRNIFEDPDAAPLVSYDGPPSEGRILYTLSTNSIEMKTAATLDRQVRVNVLYNPFFSVTIDGRTAPIVRTADERMQVSVPAGEHAVIVEYWDPYFYIGAALAGAFLFVFAISTWGYTVKKAKCRRPTTPVSDLH